MQACFKPRSSYHKDFQKIAELCLTMQVCMAKCKYHIYIYSFIPLVRYPDLYLSPRPGCAMHTWKCVLDLIKLTTVIALAGVTTNIHTNHTTHVTSALCHYHHCPLLHGHFLDWVCSRLYPMYGLPYTLWCQRMSELLSTRLLQCDQTLRL